MSSRRYQPGAFIAARQRREAAMREFEAAQAAEERQRMVVRWEEKCLPRMHQKQLHRALDHAQALHNDTLVERRRRLADLLSREQAAHDKQLGALAETDQQRRERFIRKAQELRDRREAERRADIAHRNDRLLREKIDCIRQAESRLRVMQVSDARHTQLEAAQQAAEAARREEEFFAQQAAEAEWKANVRAQGDLEAVYARTQRLKQDLATQVAGNVMRRREADEAQRAEKAEFQRLVHEEQVQEAQRAAERREAKRVLAQEMKELNAELQRARKEEYDRLRQEDKELLDSILAELAEEEVQRTEGRRARAQAQKEEWEDWQRQLAQRHDDGDALERLWVEANDREWEKREAQWRADKEKRDKLLRSILVARREQVLEKRERDKAEAETRQREYSALLESLGKDDGAEGERQRLREKMLEHQAFLRGQMQQLRAGKEAAVLEKRQDFTEQQVLERQHKERIAHEMAQLEAAKPARYKAVPLLPPQQRWQPF